MLHLVEDYKSIV